MPLSFAWTCHLLMLAPNISADASFMDARPTPVCPIGQAYQLIPHPTIAAGAGFIMARGEVLLDVPYDPHLDMLFVGEEILHSARLYTHGYNLYAPDMNLVFHHYNRREKPSMFTDLKEAWHVPQQRSADRAKYLLGVSNITKPQDEGEHSLEYYGMGTARSVQDYLAYAAIDLDAQTHTTDQKFCRPPPLELPVAAGTTEPNVS